MKKGPGRRPGNNIFICERYSEGHNCTSAHALWYRPFRIRFKPLGPLGDPGAVSRVGRKGGTKVLKRPPGYRLSPNYFQKQFKICLMAKTSEKQDLFLLHQYFQIVY